MSGSQEKEPQLQPPKEEEKQKEEKPLPKGETSREILSRVYPVKSYLTSRIHPNKVA